MKKIGLVGGTGPESTLMYYKILNSEIDRITGGKAMPDIAIESVNFTRAWEYVTESRFDLLSDYLEEKLEALDKGGSEVISLTSSALMLLMATLSAISGEKLRPSRSLYSERTTLLSAKMGS